MVHPEIVTDRRALESIGFNIQVVMKPETTKGTVGVIMNRENCVNEADTNIKHYQRESSKRSQVHFFFRLSSRWKSQLLLFLYFAL